MEGFIVQFKRIWFSGSKKRGKKKSEERTPSIQASQECQSLGLFEKRLRRVINKKLIKDKDT